MCILIGGGITSLVAAHCAPGKCIKHCVTIGSLCINVHLFFCKAKCLQSAVPLAIPWRYTWQCSWLSRLSRILLLLLLLLLLLVLLLLLFFFFFVFFLSLLLLFFFFFFFFFLSFLLLLLLVVLLLLLLLLVLLFEYLTCLVACLLLGGLFAYLPGCSPSCVLTCLRLPQRVFLPACLSVCCALAYRPCAT